MGIKAIDSTLPKIPDNELIFVLRAQDQSSPLIILEWIKENFESAPYEKLQEAFTIALGMREWPGRKRAD
jgi:hypothetical protein